MDLNNLNIGLAGHFLMAALYIWPLLIIWRRRTHQEALAWLAMLFGATGLALQVWLGAGLAGRIGMDIVEHGSWYLLLLLSIELLALLRRFVQKENNDLVQFLGLLWLLALILVDGNLFHLPDVLWENDRYYLPRFRLVFGLALAGWALFYILAIGAAYRTVRRTWQSLHRNRISYWVFIFGLQIVHDALVWNGRIAGVGVWQLAALGMLAYLLVQHHLPDVREIIRNGMTYFFTATALAVAYVGLFISWQWIAQQLQWRSLLLPNVISALLTAFLFLPVWRWVRAVMENLMPVEFYDPTETLRDYGLRISNIIRVDELANIAVGLIIDALELSRGFLFLVDQKTDTTGNPRFLLRVAGENRSIPLGMLRVESPITQALLKNNQPLLQYDIDLLPVYQNAPSMERQWLASLNCEIYVPIFAKNRWIGLLALGGKLSGNRFTREDMNVLSTLANQTAVALENARLVENLTQLNEELKNAYQALDRANRHLERLDRTKSNFISIASHELRTPLTVMRGYVEMLLEDPALMENAYHRQMLQGIHQGTLRLHEIMDSMFDIAQIDTRTLELHLQPIDLTELVKAVSSELASQAQARKQTLRVDLPKLPIIKADPNTLRKVFYHLITNAIKFTPDGGRITIHGRVLTGNRDYPSGAVEIIVSDTGVGVDPNFRELIFTKFYQPEDDLNRHSTGKTKFKGGGAGLGLALSRGIVEAHGGKIWVESPGYDEVNFPGSDFHVLLPIRLPHEEKTVVRHKQ